MFGELHDLRHEFPEYNDRIHELKISDNHFRCLFDEYDELAHELVRIQQSIETPSDEVVQDLKLKRLKLKDQLYSILKANS
ncbi:MAG: DUF465 domain-containing protein [Methyloprofundus sp.]|nr:DUF465 domain-containing protein [Methyloprofundus sp.]MBW6452221.1 DUF465 domain-containing protein [Methyloprofundus sp.]